MFDSRVAVGAWQLVAACVLWTGHVNGVQAASRAALLASALAVLACIPVNEYLDRPKNEAVAGVVTLAALGILNGRVSAPSSRGVLPAHIGSAAVRLTQPDLLCARPRSLGVLASQRAS